MSRSDTEHVTHLPAAWRDGDREALDRLIPLVHDELRRQARRLLNRERGDHTLQTTALINEAYLRLVDQRVVWQNRTHFFAVSAQMMRRILVDHARERKAEKRGGDAVRVSLSDALGKADESFTELLALDRILDDLAKIDARRCKVVELRVFGGLENREIAEILDISPNTVIRDWNLARAWLIKELNAEEREE